jgi:hypothetical protein
MISNIRNFILKRRQAYRALFLGGGQLNPAARIVLSDLRGFCRATVSTTIVSPVTRQVDPIASAQAEGRREVWLRITQHLHIDDADLYKLVENSNGTE